MLDYIWANKEWIFSGVGILALVSLATLIKSVWPRRPQSGRVTAVVVPPNQTKEERDHTLAVSEARSVPVRAVRIAPVDFASITATIDATPPLQRDDIAKRYVGLTIRWSMFLWSASKAQGGTVRLTLDFGPGNEGLIHCDVPLDDYRELNIFERGHPITVIGEIETVERSFVRLKNVQLFY